MKLSKLGFISAALLSVALIPAGYAQNTDSDTDNGAGDIQPDGRRAGPGFAPGLRGRGEGPGGRRGGRPGGNPERLLAGLDTDGDDAISLDEFLAGRPADVDRVFERLDTDGNGLISTAELERPERPERPARPQRSERERPDIDRQEVLACVRETIADFDPPEAGFPAGRLANADIDADGNIDLAELSAALNERAQDQFERLDFDGNGLINQADFQTRRDQQLNVRRVLRACIDEQAATG